MVECQLLLVLSQQNGPVQQGLALSCRQPFLLVVTISTRGPREAGADDVEGQQDVSSGLAKEGRLTRMMESMKKKLDQLKSENAQLEDLLRQAEAASQGWAFFELLEHYFHRM